MFHLEAKNIVKRYGDYTALNDVSIRVPKASIYGLLGPNGAGKSSLIRIINRITMPDEGQVLIDGHPSTANDVSLIGYLPEERGLYKKMKVEEHIMFLARLKGLSKSQASERVAYWMEKFHIQDWKSKKIEELSKGMAQKIQFIACVIHDPQLLILDEPFSGFDPVNAELLRKEILELKDQGKTIILSTHNMGSVESLCDEISLINKSKVMLEGGVRKVREQYKQHIFEVKFKGDEWSFTHPDFEQLSIDEKDGETSVRIQYKGHEIVKNSQLIGQIAANHEILSFIEELPSMNDIFIQIVEKQSTTV